jgi:hypothetical protein
VLMRPPLSRGRQCDQQSSDRPPPHSKR